eukprot:11455-Prymnesium_polylepis.1
MTITTNGIGKTGVTAAFKRCTSQLSPHSLTVCAPCQRAERPHAAHAVHAKKKKKKGVPGHSRRSGQLNRAPA